MEENIFEGLKYLLSFPKGFRQDQKYPLIIFLHGAGTRSDSLERLGRNANVGRLLERQDARGYLLLAPLCPNADWNEWMKPLVGLVKHYRTLSYIDETRVYLTGNSMGGYGTWTLATHHPDWFAAAMPVCGGGVPAFTKGLVDLPIRAFHGLKDTLVDPIESLQMVKAVNRNGGYAELILFPECAHNCWSAVYSDESNYDWLLSFTTERKKTEVEELTGDYYG